MLKMNPLLLTDFYKIGHVFQYPPGTEYVYSNLTPRSSRIKGVDEMVFFGLQYFIKAYLMDYFQNFFTSSKREVLTEYRRVIEHTIGQLPRYNHIEELHELGYLPVRIKALPEGTRVPMRVPCVTIINTDKRFYWLTNFLETIMSSVIWQPCTSATLAYQFRLLLNRYAAETGMPPEFVGWQGHDFSFRGMSAFESAYTSGMGHLLSFTGTDTIPAILAMEEYYGADCSKELVGGSVAATEHSVMCSGEQGCELETINRLITEVYSAGIVSIVSDTWDLWKVCMVYLPLLKDKILAREGKIVVRPDSGDPVKIICGDPNATRPAQIKGVVELLWETFSGTVTSTGHRLLNSHVGVIYGDSINLDRAKQICERLKGKGFASQCVLGIGSYTYQHNTRDTFGTAIKATWVQINGQGVEIFKDPVTDDGVKKSAKGLIKVYRHTVTGDLSYADGMSWTDEARGELVPVFCDGKLLVDLTLAEVRKKLWEEI